MRNNVDADSIAIIAHSMGGIVARKLLVSQRYRQDPLTSRIDQVTFVASPHHGAVLAKLGEHVPAMRHVQLSEIGPSSPVLFELNEQWQAWTKENSHRQPHVRSVFGTADAVVSANNARGLDPEAIPILGAGHRDVVKPASPNDEIVQTLARFLRGAWCGSAAQTRSSM